MIDESQFDDTPETAPVQAPRQPMDPKKARDLRDSPQFKALRKKFRDDCSRWRDPKTGRVGRECHLCGDQIDYRLPAGHPQAFELDHIETVKERPDLLMDRNNFGASHHDCNQRRGTDEPQLHLGEPSEIW